MHPAEVTFMNEKKVDLPSLKSKGFLPQKQENTFSMRLHSTGGRIEAAQLRAIADAAEKYGDGHIHITSRQGVEIPFVKLENTDSISEAMENADLFGGASGKKVRGVVACQGNTVCNHGLINCPEIAEKIDSIYFGTYAPKKFKIAVTGCPAACMKPQENDFGIMGTVLPTWVEENCVDCGRCVKTCKAGALSIEDGKVEIDREKCILCGECISACKKDALRAEKTGYTIFVGGKVGRFPRACTKLLEMADEAQLFSVLEKTLEYYREHGMEGERFGDLLDRLGFEKYREKVLP